ncbi:unnamed protein product, partial [Prunus brigantina]
CSRTHFNPDFYQFYTALGANHCRFGIKKVSGFGLTKFVDGHIKRPQDEDIQSNVLESGMNIQSTYITCPAYLSGTLGIKLPFLVML